MNNLKTIKDKTWNFLVLVQRELLKIRYRWNDADKSNDNDLDIDEFLSFRHPEIAGESYRHVVDDMVLRMGSYFSFFSSFNSIFMFFKIKMKTKNSMKLNLS